MSRPVALSVLRARVRKHADLGPDTTSASARWPNADVNREINASWQALRRKLVGSDAAKTLYCKLVTSTTASGATANKSWTDLSLPADLAHLVGLEVLMANGRYRSLTPMSFDQRNNYYSLFGLQPSTPLHFFLYNMGVETTSTVSTGLLGLVPATDNVYTYNLWYLPSWVDRTSDTDVFDGIEGFDDWCVWDTVCKIAMADGGADGGMGAVGQMAAIEREKSEEDIMRSVNGIQRVGPITRDDTVGQEQNERREQAWRYGFVP